MSVADIRIETARLILRPTRLEDLDGFAAFGAGAETMRFMGGAAPRPAVWRGVMTLAGSWALHGFAMFSVIEKSSGAWIGRIGPWRPEGWPGDEIGWGLLPEYWGKGYATEAAAASMDFAVDTLGWTEIIHTIDPENAASIAVAQRLGSRVLRKAVLPAPLELEVDVWGQSAAEWRENRKRLAG